MLTKAKKFFTALLWDEAAGQRYTAVGLYALGGFLESGGVVPGTGLVVPHLVELSRLGPWLKYAGLYLGAAGALPKAPQ